MQSNACLERVKGEKEEDEEEIVVEKVANRSRVRVRTLRDCGETWCSTAAPRNLHGQETNR